MRWQAKRDTAFASRARQTSGRLFAFPQKGGVALRFPPHYKERCGEIRRSASLARGNVTFPLQHSAGRKPALCYFHAPFHEQMQKTDIPKKTIYRLSIYNRALQRLRENGGSTVSSEALATAAGVKPTQLRKDLTYFGQWGTRGLGYNVEGLITAITGILGMAKLQPVILVGAGQLGTALLRYGGFAREGFEVVAAFDEDVTRKRPRDIGIPILPMEQLASFVRERSVKLAILTVPGKVAQEVANRLIECGVQAILNFAPAVLHVPERIAVNNVDLAIQLENLSYFVK